MARKKQTKYLKHALKCRSKKKKMVKPIKKIKVAVYGTLMEGCLRNAALENAVKLGNFQTEPIFTMYYSYANYPFLIKNGGTAISMEVYEFTNPDILNRLDHIEGIETGLFQREELNTPYGKAKYYFMKGKDNDNSPIIESGDWKDYLKIKDSN